MIGGSYWTPMGGWLKRSEGEAHRRRSRGSRIAALIGLSLFAYSGCSHGTTSANGLTWDYVALGDSIAAGQPGARYVETFAEHIRQDTGAIVGVTNLGMPGWTSGDLLAALRRQDFRQALRGAEVITLNIGTNDLASARDQFVTGTCGGSDDERCLRTTVRDVEDNWDAIVELILELRSPRETIIRMMDVYEFLVDEDKANGTFPLFHAYLDEVNTHIASLAERHAIPLASVHLAFNGPEGDEEPSEKGLLLPDGVHPNVKGTIAIADLLRGLGYDPLA
jgi:lysophospholipase L1-like esterase